MYIYEFKIIKDILLLFDNRIEKLMVKKNISFHKDYLLYSKYMSFHKLTTHKHELSTLELKFINFH